MTRLSEQELPPGWSMVRLGDLAHVKYGKAIPKDEGPYPAIGSGGEYARVNQALIEYPTIVVGRKGTAGRAWLSTEPSWPSDTTFYLDWTSEVEVEFIYSALIANPIRGVQGDVLPSLKRPDLQEVQIALPPLPEQRAIAHVLRCVQQAKGATEQVIAAARELKASLVSEYVTPEETPNTWSTRAIEEVASRVEYGISKRGGPAGRYPILRMNSISNGRVITDDLQRVDLTDDEFRRFKLERGDVLFNRTNSIDKVGKSAYFDLDGDWVFASYLLRVTADETVLVSRFLNYFLGAPSTQTVLKGLATRAVSQANINATKLKSLSMPVPPLSEQHEIANSIQAIDEKIDAEEARRDAVATLFDSLLRDLMTARLRVADLEVSV